MSLLISLVDGRAVEVEVGGYHRLGRATADGVSVDIDSVERQGIRYLVDHGLDVAWWDESAALR